MYEPFLIEIWFLGDPTVSHSLNLSKRSCFREFKSSFVANSLLVKTERLAMSNM